MILDNENDNLKVHEWISKYTDEGELDIVTGYFTIGALQYLSQQVNQKIDSFRMVLGDIVNIDTIEERPLDLLNENITIEAALKLSSVAKQAVEFLRQDKVKAKTLEPNFCHAKTFLFEPKIDDDRNKYFISGSSNLTEAGMGIKKTHNVELNIAETGNNNQYQELIAWFDDLWKKPQAHTQKTIIQASGAIKKIDFKKYLIQEIEKIFIEYSPNEIYYKILFELFGNQILETESDPEFKKHLGRLENSVIYNSLYDFQKKGVLSLIRMLQKYDGAILADAVGLGKTWSALAVIKYYENLGRDCIILCPKKLQLNWVRYKQKQDSRFENDKLNYAVRFHTDLQDERLEKYELGLEKLTGSRPKLLIIDESHNLRNNKSNRYQFLLENIIRQNEDIKVLLLSATPINNSLNDIRNQFNLIAKGNPKGFDKLLGVRDLNFAFRAAQKAFNEWRESPNPQISEFVQQLPPSFFTLTDSLTVARTRKMVAGQQNELFFPKKTKPKNLFVTPKQLGNLESFEELFKHFPPKLSGYQPSTYLKKSKNINILKDEQQRDHFLVKMMYILMVKRLESSWISFYETTKKIRDHHQNALNKITKFLKNEKDAVLTNDDISLFEGDELEAKYEDLTLGKKRKVSLKDIHAAGKLKIYKNDLKKDIEKLDYLCTNLQQFKTKVDNELNISRNHDSEDDKLQQLIYEIKEKRRIGKNKQNPKVVIFTVYRDTADYLFKQLTERGFDKVAMVSGSGSKVWDSDEETKNFEPILERFAPYTKLFKERVWNIDYQDEANAYNEWSQWIAENHPKIHQKLKSPIDILIATDSLSEGQNLQDADMVINYDIHWNPVRIIQRLGRIGRLGSPNDEIFSINFWPSNNINTYLNLQGRIEQRMAAMRVINSEVDMQFSDSFEEMARDESLEQRMKDKMLRQMEVTMEDLDGEETFGFDDLSLEQYRQELLAEFNRDKAKYINMPKGVYTGFKADTTVCPQEGIIALLGYPAKPDKVKDYNYQSFDLIYINKKGEQVLTNQKEILDAITFYKDYVRDVPEGVEKGVPEEIATYVHAMKNYLQAQAVNLEINEQGELEKTAGKETIDILQQMQKGNRNALNKAKQNKKIEDKYQLDQVDLITWFVISK